MDERIARMSLEEKAEFLTGKAFFLTRDLPRLGIRSLRLADGPNGVRKTLEKGNLMMNRSVPATCFPASSAVACSFDVSLGEEIGRALGEEAAAQGVDVLLGPGLNLQRDPRCGRNFEYFSEDPYLSGKMAAAYVRGVHAAGVGACIKHFAANNREYRRSTSDSAIDERTLRELYLRGFELAVREGAPDMVMTAYNKINGVYADENGALLSLLRDEWGFCGAVVSDWGACNDRVKSVRAGSDLEMPACRYGADDLVAAVRNGTLEERALDRCAERLLALADRRAAESAPFDEEAHHALARRCAAECFVLLENDGVLPLSGREKILLVGDFARRPRIQGAGSARVHPTRESAFAQTLKEEHIPFAYARGYQRYGGKSGRALRGALKAAKEADVVLFFAGPDEFSEAEGVDRADLRIPDNQKRLLSALLKTGKKVVVLLGCGAPVETDWTAGANALLFAGLPGQAGGAALCDVLFGRISPSGKLAQSWARPEDYPTAPAALFPGGRDRVEYREGLFVGYRYFTSSAVKARYPFGYGKSYTSFAYSDLAVGEDRVTFTLQNTGSRAGTEIAQVYVSKPQSPLVRPALELRGFVRVPLEGGEKRRVTVLLDGNAYSYYNKASGRFEREGGRYEIKVGASSEDIRLIGGIEIGGELPENERARYPRYAAAQVREIPDGEFYDRLGGVPPPERREGGCVDENTTVEELRHARGWTGRAFAGAMGAILALCRLLKRRAMVNTLLMGVWSQPLRSLAQFGGFTRRRTDAFVEMCNGHFFRGVKDFFAKNSKGEEK